jgi:hypothetical protein
VIPRTHGYVVVRKRPSTFAPSQLTAWEEGEPREAAALLHNIEQLHADDRHLREMLKEAIRRGDTEHLWRVAAQTQVSVFAGGWRTKCGPQRRTCSAGPLARTPIKRDVVSPRERVENAC